MRLCNEESCRNAAGKKFMTLPVLLREGFFYEAGKARPALREEMPADRRMFGKNGNAGREDSWK